MATVITSHLRKHRYLSNFNCQSHNLDCHGMEFYAPLPPSWYYVQFVMAFVRV